MANVTVLLSDADVALAVACGEATWTAIQGVDGKYQGIVKRIALDGKVADPERHTLFRRHAIYGYCRAHGKANGYDVAISKDRIVLANADGATPIVAAMFDKAKGRGQSAVSTGLARAYEDCGIAPPAAQNAGGRKASTKDTTDATSATPAASVTAIPLSFDTKLRELQSRVVAFQSTAKLTKNDKEAIGKIATNVAELVDMLATAMQPKSETPTPKDEAPKDDAPKDDAPKDDAPQS